MWRARDLGYLGEDGYFTITGRKGDLTISGGYNVYPLEEVLEACPGVAEVGEQLAAVVVPDDPDLSAEKPRQVVFVDALPRNALAQVLGYRVREGLIEAEG